MTAAAVLKDMECPKCHRVFPRCDFNHCPYCENDVHDANLVPGGPTEAELAAYDESRILPIALRLGTVLVRDLVADRRLAEEHRPSEALAIALSRTFDLPIPPCHLDDKSFLELCRYVLWAEDHREHLRND